MQREKKKISILNKEERVAVMAVVLLAVKRKYVFTVLKTMFGATSDISVQVN